MSKSILEPKKVFECFSCGDTRNLEEHHVFFGKNRKMSEHYGLKIHLCPACHRSHLGIHGGNVELDQELKTFAQKTFEKKYSHELFMEKFGRNYL